MSVLHTIPRIGLVCTDSSSKRLMHKFLYNFIRRLCTHLKPHEIDSNCINVKRKMCVTLCIIKEFSKQRNEYRYI